MSENEMCYMQLAENTGRKKSQLRTRFLGYIFALRHVSTVGKNFKQQYLLHVSSQYGEIRPTNG